MEVRGLAHPLEGEAGARAEAGLAVDWAVAAVRLEVDAARVAHYQPCNTHKSHTYIIDSCDASI